MQLKENTPFEDITIGAELPSLTKTETQESIDAYNAVALVGSPNPRNVHTDADFASKSIFAGRVNNGIVTMAYITEMLEKVFPLTAFYNGGRLEMKATAPIRADDTITITGKVTDKRTEDGKKLVDCEITAVNQLSHVAAVARATLSL